MLSDNEERDARIHARAIAHAQNELQRIRALRGGEITEHDIARAFVVGYAAGLEDGRSAVGRRTVRK